MRTKKPWKNKSQLGQTKRFAFKILNSLSEATNGLKIKLFNFLLFFFIYIKLLRKFPEFLVSLALKFVFPGCLGFLNH